MNTKHLLFILFVILAQVLAACGAPATPVAVTAEPTTPPPAPTATPEPVDPATVVQDYLKALDNGDIEAAMAFVAEDIKCRGEVYLTGKERFRLLVEADMKSGGRMEISDLKVDGDKVTYNWEAYNEAGFFLARGVEMLQIKDGQIIYCEGRAL